MLTKEKFFVLIKENKVVELEIFIKTYKKLMEIDSEVKDIFEEKDEQDLNGLSLAAAKGFHLIVAMLIKEGVKVNSLSVKGKSTALTLAAEKGHATVVNSLALAGANVNFIGDDESPLFKAAFFNHLEVVETLLQYHVNADLGQISTGCTPLNAAISKGNSKIALKLIEKSDLNKVLKNGFTSIHIAAEKGNVEVIHLLKEKGVDLNKKDISGQTPLMLAALNKQLEAFKTLIELGADCSVSRADGLTPMHVAASFNHIEMLTILLNKEANVNTQTILGDTPLWHAAKNGQYEAVEFLLKNKANPNFCSNEGSSPIAMAIQEGKKNVFDLLLKWKVSLNIPIISEGRIANLNHVAVCYDRSEMLDTLIQVGVDKNQCLAHESVSWMSASRGFVECLQVLIKHNADINFLRESDDLSLLDIAAYKGHISMTRVLIHNKLNVNNKTSGYTPLYLAAQNGHVEVAYLLLEAKALIDLACPKTSETALHGAAKNNHLQVLILLLSAKANINKRRADGATAIFVAAINNHYEAVRMLLEKGADITIPLNDNTQLVKYIKQRGLSRISSLLEKIESFSKRLENYDGEIDEDFIDPIMKVIMDNPVMLSNGMIVDFLTFSRFEKLPNGNIKNPLDQNTYLLPNAYPCIELRSRISDFVLSVEKNKIIPNKSDSNSENKSEKKITDFFQSQSLSDDLRQLITKISLLSENNPEIKEIIDFLKNKKFTDAAKKACVLTLEKVLKLILEYLNNISSEFFETCINKPSPTDGKTLMHLLGPIVNKTNDITVFVSLVKMHGDIGLSDKSGNTPLDYLNLENKEKLASFLKPSDNIVLK